MAPDGKAGLCVEVTGFEGDGSLERTRKRSFPEIKVRPRAAEARARSEADFGDGARRARARYVSDLRSPVSRLASRSASGDGEAGFGNLKLLGRTGAYWYNNSDHSMKMALHMAKSPVERRHPWKRRKRFSASDEDGLCCSSPRSSHSRWRSVSARPSSSSSFSTSVAIEKSGSSSRPFSRDRSRHWCTSLVLRLGLGRLFSGWLIVNVSLSAALVLRISHEAGRSRDGLARLGSRSPASSLGGHASVSC